MEVEPCVTCQGVDFVEFKSEGDLVCRSCGTVKESRLIDERSEWRTFSDKDKDTTDPNRVGGPTNHLLEGLTTTIGRERNDGGLSYALNRIHARTNNPDRLLVAAFKEVGQMCDKLKVNGYVKDRACEIYKEVVEAKTLKGRSVKALAASCLFMACRQEKQTRTFKEIVALLGNDVSKKEIGRCFKDLQQLKKDELHRQGASADALASTMNQTVQHPAEFVRNYAIKLAGKDFKIRQLAEQIAQNAKPQDRRVPWDGRTPTSIASAIMFIAMMISEIRKEASQNGSGGGPASYTTLKAIKAISDTTMQRVALVSSVAEATIRAAYKDLFPHIPQLLPPGAATPEEIARLPNPDARNLGGASFAPSSSHPPQVHVQQHTVPAPTPQPAAAMTAPAAAAAVAAPPVPLHAAAAAAAAAHLQQAAVLAQHLQQHPGLQHHANALQQAAAAALAAQQQQQPGQQQQQLNAHQVLLGAVSAAGYAARAFGLPATAAGGHT